MRVLLVDHDSEGLEAVARAIRGVLDLDCVTSKGDALLLLRQNTYDVLIACERAIDGSGLDLLGRTTRTAAPLKRIFAAAPERLQLLGPRLAPFKVQRTINYPIDLEELWLAIAQVTSGPNDETDGTIERVVLDERGIPANPGGARSAAPSRAPVAPPTPAPQPPQMIAASTGGRAAVVRLAPQVQPAPQPPPAARPPAATPLRASAPTPMRAAPQARSQPMRAPAPPMQPIPPMPMPAAQASAPRAAMPAWTPEGPADDDFAAVAAQARMGVQQKGVDEASRRKKRRVLVACSVAVAVAATLVILIESFYDPGRAEREAREAAIAAAAARFAEEQDAADTLSRIEIDVETAIMNNDLDVARTSLADLRRLKPDHPRLEFLDASIRRAAELAALASAAAAQTERAPEPRALRQPVARAGSNTTSPRADSRRAESFSGRTLEASDSRATPEPASAPATPSMPAAAGSSTVARDVSPPAAPAERLMATTAAPGATPTTINSGAALPAAAVVTVAPPSAPPVQIVPAKITKRINPTVPSMAVSRRISGFVVVTYTIDQQGKVRDIEVVEADPQNIFEDAVRDAVARWQYQPRTENGVAVESRGRARLIFGDQ